MCHLSYIRDRPIVPPAPVELHRHLHAHGYVGYCRLYNMLRNCHFASFIDDSCEYDECHIVRYGYLAVNEFPRETIDVHIWFQFCCSFPPCSPLPVPMTIMLGLMSISIGVRLSMVLVK